METTRPTRLTARPEIRHYVVEAVGAFSCQTLATQGKVLLANYSNYFKVVHCFANRSLSARTCYCRANLAQGRTD